MKFKIYTEYDTEAENMDFCHHRYTSQEYSTLSSKQKNNLYSSKKAIVRDFLSHDSRKLVALDYLIQYIQNRGYCNILSLGAGTCVIEYLLSCALPETTKITATDFNEYYVRKSREFFQEITTEKFDFYHDTIGKLSERTGTSFDFAYFLGSAYVLDNDEYIDLFLQLRDSGIRSVIDLSPALVPYSKLPFTLAGEVKNSILKTECGKFHGFSRTKNDHRYMYKKAGWMVEKEMSLGPYNYVSVLINPHIQEIR